MKNLIDPKTLALFKEEPVPISTIVKFLDNNSKIKTSYLCKLIGIPPKKIYDHRTYHMKKKKNENIDITPKVASKNYARYTAKEKLELAKTYYKSNAQEKAELLRKYGLYQSNIERWWDQIETASLEVLGKRKTRSDKKSNEQVKIEKLEQELMEQEKTTAKLSTLLILQKKTLDIIKK